jgi:hypothetical protein
MKSDKWYLTRRLALVIPAKAGIQGGHGPRPAPRDDKMQCIVEVLPDRTTYGPPFYERGLMHNRCREDEFVEGRHGGQP